MFVQLSSDFVSLVFTKFHERLRNGFSLRLRLVFISFLSAWQPPALPHRLQCSTIGRFGLNLRVRDGYGCVPKAHRHQESFLLSLRLLLYAFRLPDNSTVMHLLLILP